MLSPGTKLGPYEVQCPLGAGGMGEVYRARDTRLERSVAVKILPSHLCSNSELKSRFEREAKTLSSVSHPHICHLYDVGSQSGVDFLVMELLEGETLAQRLQKGPMPAQEVLKVGIEIADALSKAHRLGVIHRDLKPSNIMLTRNGAKLMDFGLAKPGAMVGAAFAGAETVTLQSPATPISAVGTVVGTIHYMAPEQVEGKEADARSDIFALGAVLYEMTSGERAFEGKSHLSVASAILQKDPLPISAPHAPLPPGLDYVIRTCLAKDPEDRFQTAHDVKLQLSWLSRGEAPIPQAVVEKPKYQKYLVAALAAVVVILAALFVKAVSHRPEGTPHTIARFSVAMPSQQVLAADSTQAVVLSPDGSRMAYVAEQSGLAHLYVKRLDQFTTVQIPDSEGVTFPFFSPHGDWIAFFSQGKLKKAPSDGGVPVVICEVPTFFGGTWTPKDVIVAAVPSTGLATVPAGGGSLQKLNVVTKDHIYAEGPAWLPGSDWILFTDYLVAGRRVMAVNLNTGELRLVLNNAQSAGFAGDRLVYYSGGSLWSVPFDPAKPAMVNNGVQIESGIAEENYVAQSSTALNGTLAYAPGVVGNFSRNLYFVSRNGVEQKADIPPQDYVDLRFSPDSKRVVVALRRLSEQALAVFDRDRGVLMTLVSNGGINAAPAWTPDGKDIYFDISAAAVKRGIYHVAADGSGAPQFVQESSLTSHVTSIAGNYAAVMVNDPVTSTDVWLLSLDGKNEMRPFRRTPAMERQGTLSPDGHWVAYSSNESGTSEVYVEPVPGPGGRSQISSSGGEQPRWARNGKEIFYRNGTKMFSVAVEIQPTFRASKPVELFDAQFDRGGSVGGYDVSADGQTFVMTRSEHPRPTEIHVVLGSLAGAPDK